MAGGLAEFLAGAPPETPETGAIRAERVAMDDQKLIDFDVVAWDTHSDPTGLVDNVPDDLFAGSVSKIIYDALKYSSDCLAVPPATVYFQRVILDL